MKKTQLACDIQIWATKIPCSFLAIIEKNTRVTECVVLSEKKAHTKKKKITIHLFA